jgi:succinyl-diaminopimelate desuccinylase
MTVDMRTVPSQDHQEILRQARHIAEELAAEFHPDLRVEIEIDNNKTPIETDRDEPLVQALIAAAAEVRGTEPVVGGVTYGTDAAALAPGFGIPMVICGPGAPGMAHQPDEWVPVDQLVQAAQIYTNVAQRLLG